MCSARRLGSTARKNAAPQPSSPRPTSQVQPTCLPSRRKTCRGSQTFNPHHSTLFQGFVKLPCPCQVRCPGNPERGFMKKLINNHTVILQKQEELLARSAIDKNSIPDKREALVAYRQSASLRVPTGKKRLLENILVIPASGSVNTAKVACAKRAPKSIK